MQKKKWFKIGSILLSVFILTSCGGKKEEEAVPTPQPIEKEEVEIIEKEPTFAYHYPLSGVGTNNQIDGRAVAVVINNDPLARQQSGLHQADLVYEVMTEGKITRFLAIFQSEQPERIGPVRSARDYFIELAKGYESIFVAHGYSPDAYALLQSGYINELNGMNYDGSLFKRSSDRRAPHNSYTSYDNILKGSEQRNYDVKKLPKENKFMTETEVEEVKGTMVESIAVSYGSSLFQVTYEYDKQKEKFTRTSNSEQTIDLDTKKPVLLDNVFIVETGHRVIDEVGRISVDLTAGGKGYLFQKGKMKEVQWKNESGRIVPIVQGQVEPFIPGKTWINFVSTSPGLEQSVTIE